MCLLHCPFDFRGGFADVRDSLLLEWQGVDTVIITAGVISLQPLLSIANLKHESDHVELEGVKRVVDVAQAALHSNFFGPLVTATTFVCEITPSGIQEPLPFALDSLATLHIKLTLDTPHILLGLCNPRTHTVLVRRDEILCPLTV